MWAAGTAQLNGSVSTIPETIKAVFFFFKPGIYSGAIWRREISS